MILLRNFKNIFVIPDLRKKLGFTFFVLAVFRLGVHVPIPGVDPSVLVRFMSGATGGFLSYFDLISGGAFRKCAIFALGISPYISASIMMTILTVAVPTLEALAKEGEYGRKIINQYTRYLTLLLSFVQGYALVMFAERQPGLVLNPGWSFRLTAVLILSVGSLFVMWLGEQISSHGVGNGSSLLIFGSIVAGLPGALVKVANDIQLGQFDVLLTGLLVAITVAVVTCVVFLEKGERKIPVQYAKRIVGNRMYGGQSSYIPFKINPAGVIPVIFAANFIGMPMLLTRMLSKKIAFFESVASVFEPGGIVYSVLLVALIVFFSFFYTAIQLNPEELAENMRKSGGFIPAIRPGRKTVEFFNYVLMRVGFPGALYLAALTIVPGILKDIFHFPAFFDGLSLLIAIGVALDTSAQIESYLIQRRYEGFLATGRLRGRGGR